tara:strand:- start:17084 stop:17677 length:594 start_codon:yes stop_codon:yes gene_type:complete
VQYIVHEVNTIEKLQKIPKNYGIEIDIRLLNNELVLGHDIKKNNVPLNVFLKQYDHSLIVANIKESGIEDLTFSIFEELNVNRFFLLDVEFPYIYKNFKTRGDNLSLRFSELEPRFINSTLIDKVHWLWIDSFTELPIDKESVKYFKNFESCLVSPSRWGRVNNIEQSLKTFKKFEFFPDWIMVEIDEITEWENSKL